ncbi:hypothetical protein [Pseudolabrys sp.]|uniref:hypothetical protein n=1 Tax=Pseudolabrys sp. TaxID=1960880 RepID=UPI003D0DB633
MRFLTMGFHVVMVLLVIATFMGAFSPAPTGNFAHDNGSYIMPLVGVVVVWVVGSIILRMIRKVAKY